MALHILPDPEDGHRRDETCPCSPTQTVGTAEHPSGRGRQYRGVIFTHRPFGEAPAEPELGDRIAVPAEDLDDQVALLPTGIALIMPGEDPGVGPEAECGHVVVQTNDGEWQHHAMPGDDAPHAPTSECGCGPQREVVGGHVVYQHADQNADDDADGGGEL